MESVEYVDYILMETEMRRVGGFANIARCGCRVMISGRRIPRAQSTRKTNTQRSMVLVTVIGMKRGRGRGRALSYLKAQRTSFIKRRCINLASSGMWSECIRARCAGPISSIPADSAKVALVKHKKKHAGGRGGDL